MRENRKSLKSAYTSENKLSVLKQKIQKPSRYLRYVYYSYRIAVTLLCWLGRSELIKKICHRKELQSWHSLLKPVLRRPRDGVCGLSSLSEKTRTANRLQMSQQRKHFLLSYFKTLSVCPVNAWSLQLPHDSQDSTTYANQAAVTCMKRFSRNWTPWNIIP